MNASFSISLLIRLVAIVVPIALFTTLPVELQAPAYMVWGFGHIWLAFWYQADAGKWTYLRITTSLALLLALVFLNTEWFGFFSIFTTFIFTVHMMLDEVHLLGEKPSLFRTFEALPFIILYTQLSATTVLGTTFIASMVGITFGVMLVYVLFVLVRKYKLDRISYLAFAWAGLALVASLIVARYGPLGDPRLWFFGIGIAHFIIWYGEYYRRVASDTARRTTYLLRVVLVNVATFATVVLYSLGLAPVFALLFTPVFVNAWTILHILTSFRLSTLRLSVTL